MLISQQRHVDEPESQCNDSARTAIIHRPLPFGIVLLFIAIILGYVFEYNLCKNVTFGELNLEFDCECGNINVKYEFGDLKHETTIFNIEFDYGVLSTTPSPPAPPSPKIFNLNDSHVGLHENLHLKYVFGGDFNAIR